jgi:WD40 repeat protein
MVEVITPETSPPDPPPPGTGLVIDQFEQLFTTVDADAAAACIDGALDALEQRRIKWLAIAIRGDFYARCADHPRLAAWFSDHTMLLPPLQPDELRTIVQAPAEIAALGLEPGLVDLVLADSASEPHPLPLVSHALLETWRRRHGEVLTIADYHEAGGTASAIAATAERVYSSQLDEPGQQLARDLFLRLVEPGDGTADTRRTIALSEVRAVFAKSVDGLLGVLADARLVVVDEESVRMVHDALISEWPRLQQWVDDERQQLQTAAHLARAVQEWTARGEQESDLYRGARLDGALELEASGYAFAPQQQRFIEAARETREREQRRLRSTNRRLRRLLVAVTLLLVLAIAGATVTVLQRAEANDARRRSDAQRRTAELTQVASAARALADKDIPLAMLLALEADRLEPAADTLGTLKDVLRAQPTIKASVPLVGVDPNARVVSISADGRVALLLAGNRLTSVRLPGGVIGPAVTVPDFVSAAVSPDDTELAVATSFSVTLFDLASGRQTKTFQTSYPPTTGPDSISWNGQGELVMIGLGQTAFTVDTSTGASAFLASYHPVLSAITVDEATKEILLASPLTSTSSVIRFDAQTHAELASNDTNVTAEATDLRAQPSGSLVAIGTLNAGVLLLDAAGTVKRLGSTTRAATGVFSRDGRRLATLDSSGTIQAYDTDTGEPVGPPIVQEPAQSGFLYNDPALEVPQGLAFGDDDNTLVWVGRGQVTTIDLSGVQPLASAPFTPAGMLAGPVSSDGRTAYAMESVTSGASSAFEVDSGAQQLHLQGQVVGIGAGDLFEVVAGQGSVRTFDPEGRELARSSYQLTGTDTGVTTPDVTRLLLASADGGRTEVDSLPDLHVLPLRVPSTGRGESVPGVGISDDGRQIARSVLAPDRSDRIEVLDGATGAAVVSPITRRDGATTSLLTFSPDGRSLALGDSAGGIGLLDLQSGRYEANVFTGVRGAVRQLFFSRDGQSLFAAGGEGSFWWWDVASRQPVGDPFVSDLYGPGADIQLRHFAIPGPDGLRLWNLDTTTWPSMACHRAGRNLTLDEWHRYLPASEPYHVTCPENPAAA